MNTFLNTYIQNAQVLGFEFQPISFIDCKSKVDGKKPQNTEIKLDTNSLCSGDFQYEPYVGKNLTFKIISKKH